MPLINIGLDHQVISIWLGSQRDGKGATLHCRCGEEFGPVGNIVDLVQAHEDHLFTLTVDHLAGLAAVLEHLNGPPG